jgi:hypothetical protein
MSEQTSQNRQTIRLFHCTNKEETARRIIECGFLDNPHGGNERGMKELGYCFLSNWPQTDFGNCIIEVLFESTPHEMFHLYEVIEADKPLREFVIPAEIVNRFPRRLLTEADWEEMESKPDDWWDEYPPGEPEKTYAELTADEINGELPVEVIEREPREEEIK